jgi:hypothetical protein
LSSTMARPPDAAARTLSPSFPAVAERALKIGVRQLGRDQPYR